MNASTWKMFRALVLAPALLLALALACKADGSCCGCGPRCLEDLEDLGPCELAALFTRADVGTPLVGRARGKLLYLTDKRFNSLKLRVSAATWRGKAACCDGAFINRWIGDRRWIGSHYVIGPSWVDGRPAVIMEYPPGTKLFWNMHDELREIAPGLYLGPVYERFPCPKFRGYVALQLEPCKPTGRCQ
jgi:hypothetical protein